MTKNEFERIQKAHTKLELNILRLQAQQRILLELLIGQCVECPTGFGDFISGTVISCEDGRYVCVRPVNDVNWYAMEPRLLRLVEKEKRK